jgi:alcohol dehydrogenase
MALMRAARLHAIGEPMSIDMIEVPKPRPTDVLVRVKACGIVPNMANVISNWPTWFPHQPLAHLPAIFGLDPAGVVEEVGEAVIRTRPGERVYVNPLRSCGSCHACQGGQLSRCRYFTLNGYFSTSRDGQRIFDLYPYGGFAEFMTAPQQAPVSSLTTSPSSRPAGSVTSGPPTGRCGWPTPDRAPSVSSMASLARSVSPRPCSHWPWEWRRSWERAE